MTTSARNAQSHGRVALAAGLLALLALALLAAGPANAAESCGKRVIDDWYDNGRVDGTYALHCYDDAIDILPRDVRDYSSAKDDIQRALQNRKRGEPAPPADTDPTPDDGGSGSGSSGGSGTPGSETTPTETTGPTDGDDEAGSEAVGAIETDPDSASSVPIPLLILAGLALLLVIGGSVGYVIRRMQARRLPPTTL